MTQRDGDGKATGITGSSNDRKEEPEVPFDPDATGVIPKLTFDSPPDGATPAKGTPAKPATPEEPTATPAEQPAATPAKQPAATPAKQPAATPAKPPAVTPATPRPAAKSPASAGKPVLGGDDEVDSADSETTAEIRLPLPAHIGRPPTADPTTRTPEGSAAAATAAETTADVRTGSAPRVTSPSSTAPSTPGPRTQQDDDTVPTEPETPAATARPGSGPQKAGTPPPASAGSPQQPAEKPQEARSEPQHALSGATQAPSGPQEAPSELREVRSEASDALGEPQRARREGGLRGWVGRLVGSAPTWLPALLAVEGLVMYVLALKAPVGPMRGVNPADIDGLGLISALPVTAFAALLIMLVSFFVTVTQRTDRKFLLLFQIAAITFALHGAGALVAQEPRFPTAYIHAGFVEFIARTGETAINIDARMGWPGFFALFAFVTKAAGITDLTPILQWTPLLSNLLYLLPFVLILRQVVATTRARWFAALLFVLVQWIGQDYFSPQGFTFALYLAFVAILLRWFGRVEPRTKPIPPKGLRKLIGRLDAMIPGELANTGTFRADKLLMLLMLVALFLASVASHQITPFMMLGVVTAFLLFKRTSLTWALPFVLGMVVLAWISYMTVGFWAGQIDTIFGGFGDILANLRSNTGDRIEGTDPAHAMVLQARLGILVVILSLAAAGLLRRLRRGVFDRSALILLCVPVLALALQSYGGEIGLRIYMFALPGACLLAAYAFFPNLPSDSADVREETVPIRKRNIRFNPELTKRISFVLAACFAVLFAMAFLLARYGNEQFERVTSGEVAALHYVYDHDKPSARVLYLVPREGPEVTPTLPWGERDVELVSFNVQALVHKDPTQIDDAVKALRGQPRNSYLMVSTGQVSYLQLNEGFPRGWGEKFRAALDASPDLQKVFSNKDAALYTWKTFVRGTEIPDPIPYEGRGDPTTPWTPVGVGALILTWVSLGAYEIIRLNGPDRAPKARRRLLYLAVPSFVVAFAVIVERFVYIAQNNL
ncbi:hypothetical protein [Nonomuraea maritima]|uniref:hypothetical protein n=1 Tax=Nonomuraea maritima TaxID=683260 RepID=UPI00115FF78B|nr:hypothetical protein [Nonomuraea maritima]